MSPAMLAFFGLFARHAITLVGGALVAKGVVDTETVNVVAGAGAAVVSAAWSWNQKRRSGATVAP